MSTFLPFPRLPLEIRLAIWEMTVEPREVEIRIVRPTPTDPLERQWLHPRHWHHINNQRFEEAMSHIPTSTRSGRKARRKARDEWEPFVPYAHTVSSTIPPLMHVCRETRNHGLYPPISLDFKKQHGTDWRYVWLSLDIDLVNIGTWEMAYFRPIAASFKQFKFSRAASDEWWSMSESGQISHFVTAEKIHVVCLDGFQT